MMDEFGYMEGDATESNTYSTDPSRTMTISDLNDMGDEDDYSLSSGDTLDALSCDDTEEKSKKSKKSEISSKKKGKGKRKRGAAGGDYPVKKDGATPVVVKIEEGKGPQVKIGEINGEVPGVITATKSDNQGADDQTKKNPERGEMKTLLHQHWHINSEFVPLIIRMTLDDPDGYCRFVGAWLMMMGSDGRETTLVMVRYPSDNR